MSEAEEIQAGLDALWRLSVKYSQPAVIAEDFIAAEADEHWQKDGLDFYLVENPLRKKIIEEGYLPEHHPELMPGYWNGYVRFSRLPGLLTGYDGIYTYVPVHGGITFFQEWGDGSVTYGFDTGHINSDKEIVNNIDWMRLETEAMGRSIRIAARFERYYLNAKEDNRKKGRVLKRMNRFLDVQPSSNLGVMINLLCGEL